MPEGFAGSYAKPPKQPGAGVTGKNGEPATVTTKAQNAGGNGASLGRVLPALLYGFTRIDMLSLLFWLGQVAVMLCDPGFRVFVVKVLPSPMWPLMLDAQDNSSERSAPPVSDERVT